jgi:urease accessory protein
VPPIAAPPNRLAAAAGTPDAGPDRPVLQRAEGRAEIVFAHRDGATRALRQFQSGQMKLRLPRVHPPEAVTAVVLNTAGGLTGGDHLALAADWTAGARATLTGQAAERVYRSTGAVARVDTRLAVAAGAVAEWLPQETILFDRARLARRLDIDLDADADLLVADALVFGRTAMGERVEDCRLVDHWRIRRAGRLVHAESFRIDGDAVAVLAGPATGATTALATGATTGAVAVATVLHLAPRVERRIDEARALLEAAGAEAAASAWDGKLVVRFLHDDARVLRADLVRFLEAWRGRSLPRPWSC